MQKLVVVVALLLMLGCAFALEAEPSLEKKVATLKRKVHRLRDAKKAAVAHCKSNNSTYQAKKAEVSAQKTVVIAAKKALDQAKTDLAKYSKAAKTGAATTKKKTSDLKKLLKKIVKLNVPHKSGKPVDAKKRKEKILALAKKVAAIPSPKSTLGKSVQELAKKIAAGNVELETLKDTATALLAKYKERQAKVAAKRDAAKAAIKKGKVDLAQAKRVLNEKRAARKAARAKRNTSCGKAKTLKAKLRKVKRALFHAHQALHKQLVGALDSAQKSHDKSKTEINTAEVKIANLRKRLEHTKSRIVTLQAKMKDTRTKLDVQKAKLKTAKDAAAVITKARHEAEKKFNHASKSQQKFLADHPSLISGTPATTTAAPHKHTAHKTPRASAKDALDALPSNEAASEAEEVAAIPLMDDATENAAAPSAQAAQAGEDESAEASEAAEESADEEGMESAEENADDDDTEFIQISEEDEENSNEASEEDAEEDN